MATAAPRVLPWRRTIVLTIAAGLFVAIALLRLSSDDPSTTIATFYLLPIALLGMEFGVRGGLLGALAGTSLVVIWVVARDIDLGVGEIAIRAALLTSLGVYFGLLGNRLVQAVGDRALLADQLLFVEGLTAHGLVRLDRSGTIVGWNRGATEMLGYTEAEATSQPLGMIFRGEEDSPEPRAMLTGAARDGVWDEECAVVEKGGERRWAAVSVTPLADGREAGFAMVLRDLTEKNASRAESSRLWEVSLEMLATTGADGHFQHVNPRWEEVLGWTTEELLEEPVIERVHPGDRERTAAQGASLMRGADEGVSFENRYRCQDGSYRWLLWNSRVSPDDDLVYTAAHDITDRKRERAALEGTERELRTLSGELEDRVEMRTGELAAANKELEAFSYSVSHDLRAPLRAIDGYSQAVIEDCGDDLPPESKGHLERVRVASQRMATLIDEMLALSRVTRRELLSEPVDLSRIAGEIVSDLRHEESDREVEADIEPGLTATGDPELLRLVLHNLLENAWKFTAKTEHAVVSLAGVETAGDNATFVARDNGAGFDMRYADKLFQPFERLHRQDEFAGTGVGLATVSRVLNRHGGRIWAESSPGDGASFFFDLPTRQEHDA